MINMNVIFKFITMAGNVYEINYKIPKVYF